MIKRIEQGMAHALKTVLMVLFAVISVYPFIWVVLSSLKDNTDIYANPFGLPRVIHWNNDASARPHISRALHEWRRTGPRFPKGRKGTADHAAGCFAQTVRRARRLLILPVDFGVRL